MFALYEVTEGSYSSSKLLSSLDDWVASVNVTLALYARFKAVSAYNETRTVLEADRDSVVGSVRFTASCIAEKFT